MTRKKSNDLLSQQLRDAVDSCGMTRAEICREIGLPESTMSHFMAGQCGLALTTIDRLGKLLGLRLVSDHNTGD
jgi:plasmid maintenance system antidote protein VapI